MQWVLDGFSKDGGKEMIVDLPPSAEPRKRFLCGSRLPQRRLERSARQQFAADLFALCDKELSRRIWLHEKLADLANFRAVELRREAEESRGMLLPLRCFCNNPSIVRLEIW